MEPAEFFTAARILIVAGKGGVGKTTVAATIGLAAARLGIDTLLVEVEGKRGLVALVGDTELDSNDTEVCPADETSGHGQLRARKIRAEDALLDYLAEHGMRRFAKTLSKMAVLDTLATSTPGLKDLIVLGKIKQLAATDPADLVIVDAPASGHAISFLRSARGLQAAIDTGPIRRQADEVAELLSDPGRCQVVLVTLAEETPVNELVETAFALEDEVGISLGPTVINGLYATDAHPEPHPKRQATEEGALSTKDGALSTKDESLAASAASAADFWAHQVAQQSVQIDRLAKELPLEQIRLPRRFTSQLTRDDLHELADILTAQAGRLRFGQPR